jgi:mRNA-degrading endonuclease toxin of MazEF toxin-antitoxin module
LEEHLTFASYVQTDSLYSLEKTIVVDTIGTLVPEKMQEVKKQLSDLFAIGQ